MKTPSKSILLLILIAINQLTKCRSFQTTSFSPCHSTNRRWQLSPTIQSAPRMKKKNINYKQSSIFRKHHTQQSLSSDETNLADERPGRYKSLSKDFCSLAPLWTLLAALAGILKSSTIAPTLGSLPVMQNALSTLMLAMGLAITPNDFAEAVNKPAIIGLNALLCFGLMPLLAIGIASALHYTPSQTAGIVLLGSVSGGQASNLFALLAGGDVALSVVCTLSTTVLGVMATPLLIRRLLHTIVAVDGASMLRSVAGLVLLPLLCGLGTGSLFGGMMMARRIRPFCPMVGVLSTLILVAGGAANSAFSMGMDRVGIIGSCLLPIFGGGLALLVSYVKFSTDATPIMNEPSRRTLVIETLSKSPTLAYVLARKHFGSAAASVPAAGMISLAVVGAFVASLWSMVAPIDDMHEVTRK